MYRRRRPTQEGIHFSFDSFLDVVANVIGIIVKLILVAWVGARSYSATMKWTSDDPANAPDAPKASDDPLQAELDRMRHALEAAQAKLGDRLGLLDGTEKQTVEARTLLAQLASRRRQLEETTGKLDETTTKKGTETKYATLSLAELRERSQRLLDEVKAVQAQPPPRKALRYHAPVSREVYADELHFECRAGRVAYIDLPAMMQEVNPRREEIAKELRGQWQVTHTTSAAGPFRLRYVFERSKDALGAVGRGRPDNESGFAYGLSEWTIEPLVDQRGEALATAMTPSSDFRQLVDRLDSRLAIVTFWVYPDSFELFRHLRDHLYERGIEVAGRPLDIGIPIRASRHGTASRGQ